MKDGDDKVDDPPPEFNTQAQFGEVNLGLEMVFPNLEVFKTDAKNYNITLGMVVTNVKIIRLGANTFVKRVVHG